MVFGLGFNKAKVLSTAEKFVMQGKIPAAIEEYRKILEHDQNDLAILGTVADLYVRAGKVEEAIKRFYDLAERCVEAGLVPRAIATYKRISKVAPEPVEAFLRLGDLYSMQGLLRDARTNYMQAVDFYSARNEKDKARDIFEKVLMLDMENPQLQVRMAEFYLDTGKREEAITTYLGAIERYLDRKQPAEASTTLQAVLRLEPKNTEARLLLARAQMDQGELQQAIETLQAIPSLDSHKAALSLLFQAYDQLGDTASARQIADALFETHGDFSALGQCVDEFLQGGSLDDALQIYRSGSEKLPPQVLIEGLRKILAASPRYMGALEAIIDAYHRAGVPGEAREATESLAHAYRAAGELDKARGLYRELVNLEPDNLDHVQLLRQIEDQIGIGQGAALSSEQPAVAMVSELAAPSPEPAPRTETLPAREEQIVRQCITEAELYITYHQISRAIDTLESGLARVPGNIRLTEQLLALCEQTRDYAKAAHCCEALTEAYVKAGDGERASRYGELTLEYQQKQAEKESAAETLREPAAVESLSPPPAATLGAFVESAAESPSEVREVDLSMEWASAANGDQPAPATADDSVVEEIEFYIQAGLISDATAALARLEASSPSHPAIAAFRERLGSAETAEAQPFAMETSVVEETTAPPEESVAAPEMQSAAALFGFEESAPAVPATSAEEPAFVLDAAIPTTESEAAPATFGLEETPAAPLTAHSEEGIFALEDAGAATSAEPMPAVLASEDVPAAAPVPAEAAALVMEPTAPMTTGEPLPATFGAADESGIAALAGAEEPVVALEQPLATTAPVTAAPMFELALEETEVQPQGILSSAAPDDTLAGLGRELEQAFTVPPDQPAPSPASIQPPVAAARTIQPADAVAPAPHRAADALQDVFAEFKAEMEEPAAADDPETHFNMGVAFKEMALYDEAIGEFQKAHQLARKSNDSSNVVRCCSLLATCFLEKGLPQLAVKWYQTAVDSPGVDPESVLALFYEMGSAYEVAGEREAALRSFLEVYARNIDYRDVATRIRTLQQSP